MRFLRASFKNFRLLRNVELTFSTSDETPLTVVRAENDSGKTTTLTALQWALFGESALPAGGRDYRLHPIDWDADSAPRVPIEVELEFEHSYERRSPTGEWVQTKEQYLLQRQSIEEVNSEGSTRRRSTITLFRMTPQGAKLIEHPQPLLQEILPRELREVFFTDGDRALSFIEADEGVATKRRRVEGAIKALLGLGVLEDAQGHVKQASAEVNRRAKNLDGAGDVARISGQLLDLQNDLNEERNRLKEVSDQLSTVETYLLDADKDIEAALRKGDQEELAREREQVRTDIDRLDARAEELAGKHSDLFKTSSLALAFVETQVAKAGAALDALKDRGTIPSNAIPVLEERLEMQLCICGTPLGEGTHERQKVLELVEDQRRADDFRDRLTDLYYRARDYRDALARGTDDWRPLYLDIAKQRDETDQMLTSLRAKARELDVRIDDLGDTDISALRKNRADLKTQADRLAREQATLETKIGMLEREEKDLLKEQETLLKSKSQYNLLLSELEASSDILSVLGQTHDTILSQELAQVSETMNELFIAMIGSDPEQGAIIRRSEVTSDFDIVVYGPQERHLDPDQDLNGASRRALTLAFILALARVSEVDAPNVVDTPLGMMSGLVKRSVLETAVNQSRQLVLFLTRAEIDDCEDIVDKSAGDVFTLSNTAHYPRMLLNDPAVEERMVIRCECNHRQVCKVCERVGDQEQAVLAYRS